MRRSVLLLLLVSGVAFASCSPAAMPDPTSVATSPAVTSEPGSGAPSASPPPPGAPSASPPPPGATPKTSGSATSPSGRSPTTLIDNLYDRVDAGHWSLEEGLIATLEYLDEQRQLGTVVPTGRIVEFESTAVLEAAQGYLASGVQGPASATVAELYASLVPTPAQLRQLAAPPAALAGLSGTAAQVAVDTVECIDLWRHDPSAPSPGVRCLELDRIVLAAGRTGQIYTPESTLAPEDAARFVRLVTEALQAAWAAFAPLGDMPHADVVFDPRGSGSVTAGASMFRGEPTCIVLVYPLWLTETEPDARFVLAHEAFHCFQQHVLGFHPGRGHLWWKEGSANYFANVVYPDVDTEHDFLDALRPYEPNHTLLELSYDAFPFFQHLGNTIGDAQVVALLRHVAGGADPGTFPDMAARFHAYARDFLTDRIIDSSGTPIPIDAQAQNHGRYRPTSVGPIVEIRPKPFAIERLIVDWEEQLEFDLEQLQVGALVLAAQPYPDGSWDALPDPIRTCGSGSTHRVLVTRVESAGDASVRLNVAGLAGVEACHVRIVVHGAIEAVFTGGRCYVDDGFLHVAAGFGLSDAEVQQVGPYPRGYGFILGKASPGAEEPGFPDVTIADDEGHFTDHGSNASLVKSADLLTGTFTSDDIFGEYSCPFLTPP